MSVTRSLNVNTGVWEPESAEAVRVEERRRGQRERYARRRKFETWVAVKVPNDELEVIKKWAKRDKVSVREMVLTLVTWGMESADDRPNPSIGLGKDRNGMERSVVTHK